MLIELNGAPIFTMRQQFNVMLDHTLHPLAFNIDRDRQIDMRDTKMPWTNPRGRRVGRAEWALSGVEHGRECVDECDVRQLVADDSPNRNDLRLKDHRLQTIDHRFVLRRSAQNR